MLTRLAMLLFLAAPLAAADVPIAGATKPDAGFATLTVPYAKGDVISWAVLPAPVKKREGQPGELHVAGVAGVKYSVNVTIVNFEAKKLDQGSTELVFPGAEKKEDKKVTPKPKPKPEPAPKPKPVDPPPIPGDGLRVMIVYDDNKNLTLSQQSILDGKRVRDYLDARCPVGPNGQRDYRIWDEQTDTANAAPIWQDAMKRPRQSLPWVIVSNGRTGFEGPLPASVDEFLALLKKYEVPAK